MSAHNVDLTASRSFNHHCLCSYTVLFYSFCARELRQMPVRHRAKQKENKGYLESVGKYFIVMHRVF